MRDRFPHFDDWLAGRTLPTLKQLETFAGATHTAIGFFFGGEPPEEPLPIPDYRTVGGQRVVRPSPDLLDTIYLCQQRQAWYREFALTTGEAQPDFVGSLSRQGPTGPAATRIRQACVLRWISVYRHRAVDEAMRQFIALAEDSGILVMVSGVVGSNNTRKLDVEEFRGFALADPVTPLIFINGADSKSGQMFTLAHELAHVWLGEIGADRRDSAPTGQWPDRTMVQRSGRRGAGSAAANTPKLMTLPPGLNRRCIAWRGHSR